MHESWINLTACEHPLRVLHFPSPDQFYFLSVKITVEIFTRNELKTKHHFTKYTFLAAQMFFFYPEFIFTWHCTFRNEDDNFCCCQLFILFHLSRPVGTRKSQAIFKICSSLFLVLDMQNIFSNRLI